jgi:hypothetical protein
MRYQPRYARKPDPLKIRLTKFFTRSKLWWQGVGVLAIGVVIGLVSITMSAYTDTESAKTPVVGGVFSIDNGLVSNRYESLIGTTTVGSAADDPATKLDPICGTGTSMRYTDNFVLVIGGLQDAAVDGRLAVFGDDADFATANAPFTNQVSFTVGLYDNDGNLLRAESDNSEDLSGSMLDATEVDAVPEDGLIPDDYPLVWDVSGQNGEQTPYHFVWTWQLNCDAWHAEQTGWAFPGRHILVEQVSAAPTSTTTPTATTEATS